MKCSYQANAKVGRKVDTGVTLLAKALFSVVNGSNPAETLAHTLLFYLCSYKLYHRGS